MYGILNPLPHAERALVLSAVAGHHGGCDAGDGLLVL